MIWFVQRESPSAEVTLLFTDIEGSTRLLGELGAEGYERALAEHRRLLRHAFGRRGGEEVDTQGDAFFFVFPIASEAVEAALEGQAALAGTAVRVRMGMHTGRPRAGEEGYVGEDVHLAARIAAAAHGGQVLVSQATRSVVDGDLMDLGEHRVKDFLEPVSIFQLGQERFPPLKTISNTNLPRPASSFVGRERELAEVLARAEGGARLLTFTGPGGSGKTRLAIEAATTLVPSYKAGVFWVGLASLREASLVMETIAQTLGAKESLAAHVGEREMLLLLDNFEQVIEAAPELSALLTACPNLTFLCTSRELLRVQGEVEYQVQPLASSEAVALFCERSGLEPSQEVRELCARLDDLPLAVELAAARTSVLTPLQILERLAQRLDLLRGGRDTEARQQTLRATIEWSHDLLTEAEKQLFARLAVFVAGCTLDAAEEICGAELDRLQSLIDKSLLRRTEDRYWMLETIHEYCAEQFDRSPDAHEISSRHAAWYAELANRAEEQTRGPDEADWLDRLEAELGNLRATLAWLETTRAATDFQKLAAALWHLWSEHEHLREGTTWLQRALELRDGDKQVRVRALNVLCTLLGDLGRVGELRSLALESDRLSAELGDTGGRARALTILAWAAGADGDLDQERRLHEEAVALARADGDPWRLSVALNNLGDFLVATRELHEAVTALEEALAITRETGFPDAIARVLTNLGLALVHRGDLDRAAEHLTEAVRLFAATGSVAASEALMGLATVAIATGNPRRSARLLGASNRISNESGRPLRGHEQSLYRETLAAAAAALGEQTAAQLLAEGDKLPRDDAIAYALEADPRQHTM